MAQKPRNRMIIAIEAIGGRSFMEGEIVPAVERPGAAMNGSKNGDPLGGTAHIMPCFPLVGGMTYHKYSTTLPDRTVTAGATAACCSDDSAKRTITCPIRLLALYEPVDGPARMPPIRVRSFRESSLVTNRPAVLGEGATDREFTGMRCYRMSFCADRGICSADEEREISEMRSWLPVRQCEKGDVPADQ
jgi:hypothetical protein